jgi:hypothetical protein
MDRRTHRALQINERNVRQTLRVLKMSPERLLFPDEMILLHKAWSAGIMPDQCLAEMINRNAGICRDIAKHLHRPEDFEDAVAHTRIALITAIQRWDPDRGLRFSTYATKWITHTFRRYQTTHGKTIRIAEHAIFKWARIRKAYAEYIAVHHAEPTDEELANRTGLSISTIQIIRESQRIEPISINAPIQDPLGASIDERIATPANIENDYIESTLMDRISNALLSLDSDSRSILVRRFGLDGSKPETVHQIASRYKVTSLTMSDRIDGILKTIRCRYEIEDLT